MFEYHTFLGKYTSMAMMPMSFGGSEEISVNIKRLILIQDSKPCSPQAEILDRRQRKWEFLPLPLITCRIAHSWFK